MNNLNFDKQINSIKDTTAQFESCITLLEEDIKAKQKVHKEMEEIISFLSWLKG